VVCGPDGVAVFDVLHRHGAVSEAMLYAFDLWNSTVVLRFAADAAFDTAFD
jgi:hypothetical protein